MECHTNRQGDVNRSETMILIHSRCSSAACCIDLLTNNFSESSVSNSVLCLQPKKVVVSKYAEKDRAAQAAAARTAGIDPNDKAAAARAQAEGEMEMYANMLGQPAQPEKNELDSMKPSTNAEFDNYAKLIVQRYCTPHKSDKHFKYFVKQVRLAPHLQNPRGAVPFSTQSIFNVLLPFFTCHVCIKHRLTEDCSALIPSTLYLQCIVSHPEFLREDVPKFMFNWQGSE
jgi:hypothetical protein